MIISESMSDYNIERLINTNRTFMVVVSHKRITFLNSVILTALKTLNFAEVLFVKEFKEDEEPLPEMNAFPYFAFYRAGKLIDSGTNLFRLREFINNYHGKFNDTKEERDRKKELRTKEPTINIKVVKRNRRKKISRHPKKPVS